MVTGIRVLMFITESTNNESASFVQKPPTSRAFLRKSQRSDTQGSQFKSFSSSQSVCSSQSVSQFKSLKSHSRSQAVEVYSFSHSVNSVDSIHSKSDLINRYVYYDTRAFVYQIDSQNLSKIKAIPIFSDVTSVCDYMKLLEKIYNYNTVNPGVILFQPPLLPLTEIRGSIYSRRRLL